MLLVNMPAVYFNNKLPDDDDINFDNLVSVDGIVSENGQNIFFSPILNNNDLTYDLADSDAYIVLSALENNVPYSVILYEKSILLSDEEFETQINGLSILRPSLFDEIKAKQEPFKEQFNQYVHEFKLHSNDPYFDRSSLKNFPQDLPTNSLQKVDFSTNNQKRVQPFYDVNSKKEFEKLSKNVDKARISKDDIKHYGKGKKEDSHRMTHTF